MILNQKKKKGNKKGNKSSLKIAKCARKGSSSSREVKENDSNRPQFQVVSDRGNVFLHPRAQKNRRKVHSKKKKKAYVPEKKIT